jgi:hypothetical protein
MGKIIISPKNKLREIGLNDTTALNSAFKCLAFLLPVLRLKLGLGTE